MPSSGTGLDWDTEVTGTDVVVEGTDSTNAGSGTGPDCGLDAGDVMISPPAMPNPIGIGGLNACCCPVGGGPYGCCTP